MTATPGVRGYMYGYEGIGCIYWHMVAKLLLAVQEVTAPGAPIPGRRTPTVREGLARHVSAVFATWPGLREKSVEQYGAFPTDPYSPHSPVTAGHVSPA